MAKKGPAPFMKKARQQAQRLKKSKPQIRKASKAAIGGGKLLTEAGFSGAGRKVTKAGRVSLAATRATNLKDAKIVTDKMRSSTGR